eukprot:4721037-Amphidinium_carterae.1
MSSLFIQYSTPSCSSSAGVMHSSSLYMLTMVSTMFSQYLASSSSIICNLFDERDDVCPDVLELLAVELCTDTAGSPVPSAGIDGIAVPVLLVEVCLLEVFALLLLLPERLRTNPEVKLNRKRC